MHRSDLQDSDDDQLTRALGLNACYNFFLIATEDDFKDETTEEEDEDFLRSFNLQKKIS